MELKSDIYTKFHISYGCIANPRVFFRRFGQQKKHDKVLDFRFLQSFYDAATAITLSMLAIISCLF